MRFHLTLASAALLALSGCGHRTSDSFKSDRITIATSGEGNTDVVLIAGLMAGPQVWQAVQQPGFRYHAIQINGFGGASPEGNRNGRIIENAADEIARYIKSAGLKPVVVGHSMGGTIGLLLAARHPEAVSKLMIVDQPPYVGALIAPPRASRTETEQMADRVAAPLASSDPKVRNQFLQNFIHNMTIKPSVEPLLYKLAVSSDPDISARAFREAIVTDLTPELAKVRVPTRVLYVQPKTVALTEAQIDGFYKNAFEQLHGVELVRVRRSGHYIMLDNPNRFEAELKAFAGSK